MLLLQYVLPTWKRALPPIILFVLTLTFIPPIVDWVTSAGRGMTMAYLFQSPMGMLRSFFTFFGPFVPAGITLGIRIELAILILGVGALVYFVRKSALKSILTMICLYLVAFIAVSLPGVISTIAALFGAHSTSVNQFIQTSILHSTTLADNIHGTLRYASLTRMLEISFDFMVGRIWFIVTVLLTGTWFFTNHKQKTKAVFRNSRPERVAHYVFLLLLGLFVAYHQSRFSLNWNDWLSLFVLILSFYFSWMSAVCVNDIFDVAIDKISNFSRPITTGSLSLDETKSAAFIFLLLSLVGAYLSGYYAFFCLLAFTALYYIYSAPPVRLKRVPFLSVLIIGFCSLSAAMAGFFTFSSLKEVSAFPAGLILGIVIIFSLLPQTKDIKDIEGDRAVGIITVPILFGPVWGTKVVGILAALAYLIVPLLMNSPVLFFGAAPAAVATYLISTKKPYEERPIFAVYGLFAIFLVVVLLF